MGITGQIHRVTDRTAFFAPIVLGGGKPSTGYEPFTDETFSVTMAGFVPGLFEFPTFVHTKVNTQKGTFTLPELPGNLGIEDVYLLVEHRGRPLFRSEKFKLKRAKEGGLDVFLYQLTIPTSDGMTAGTISKSLAGSSLPSNSTLTARPWGLGIAGSQGQADVEFGVAIVPDTSWDLGSFVELQLNGWNIHVGWPSSWCKSADDILASIKSALAKDDSDVNTLIKGQIRQMLEKPPTQLSTELAAALLKNVSVTFTTLVFPNHHEWSASNTSDDTIVISVHPTIGYPRSW